MCYTIFRCNPHKVKYITNLMSSVSKNRSRVDTQKVCNHRKPSVFVEVLPNGKLRIYGAAAAARWLGVTQQSFDRVVRRHHTFVARKPKTVYKPVSARIKEAYPELFK